jgi:hypothetical protein
MVATAAAVGTDLVASARCDGAAFTVARNTCGVVQLVEDRAQPLLCRVGVLILWLKWVSGHARIPLTFEVTRFLIEFEGDQVRALCYGAP